MTDTLNVERVRRAYERIGGVPTEEEWHEVVIGADGAPVLRLNPAAAVLYAERPDARIHPEELDYEDVSAALGLHMDYLDGFEAGYGGVPTLEGAVRTRIEDLSDVAEFQHGYDHGQRVRASHGH